MDLLAKNRTLIIVEGVLFLLLGILATGLPQISTLSIELIIGWLFIIGGVVQIVRAWQTWHNHGWAMLLGALVSILVGGMMLAYPIAGIISLTLLLTIFFVIDGISKIYFGFKNSGVTHSGWVIFSGILSLIIAGIIYSGWPGTAAWVLGLLVGINMIFFGASLLALGINLPKDTSDSSK